jgi:hypothetical protein
MDATEGERVHAVRFLLAPCPEFEYVLYPQYQY